MADTARRMGRRQFVRGAGVAALAATTAAVAAPIEAQAAAGDPILLGSAANDAGAAETTITVSAVVPTLRLENPYGAFLRVNPVHGSLLGEPELGLIAVEAGRGILTIGSNHAGPASPPNPGWARVVSTATHTMTVATTPTRLLDTRSATLQTRVIAGAENIDGQGRLRGGSSLVLSLDEFVAMGEAVHLNVTVAKTAGRGYLTVWGVGARPEASALNWWDANQVLSNGALCTLGTYNGTWSAVAIYASATTAVIADLTGFDVSAPWLVNPAVLPGSSGAAELAAGTAAVAARKDAAVRSFAAGAVRASGGPRHAATNSLATSAAWRRPAARALSLP